MFALFPNLGERQDNVAGVLSGGEQQMLTMCRTLMGDPDLVIIDEPTEGLAPKLVEQVGQLLDEIARRGVVDPAGRAEAHDRAQDLAPALRDGPRPHRVRGHARRPRRQRGGAQGMARGLAGALHERTTHAASPVRPPCREIGRGIGFSGGLDGARRPMNRDRNVLIVIALVALAGLSAATYVFVTHSLGYELVCPFATGCDAVQNSPYAVLFGIPVSLLGMAGFTAYIAPGPDGFAFWHGCAWVSPRAPGLERR